MKLIIYLMTIVPFIAFAQPPKELNKEVVNYPGEGLSVKDKSKIPQAILVKKDENGKLFVLESKDLLDQVADSDAATLETLPFVPLENNEKIKASEVLPSLAKVDELDRDSPRQSWYYYWNYYPYPTYYNYYIPIYYYSYYTSYNYYPYYAYAYRGCNYYWYRAW